jgi:hypothetical protein
MNCFTYKTDTFICKKCNWTGIGSELSYGDFSEAHSIVDMDCPKCFEHIGSWLAPTLDEVRKWKVENENKPTDWDDRL